jgi:hypothetical protein
MSYTVPIKDGFGVDGDVWLDGRRYSFIMKNFYEKESNNLSSDECVVHWTSVQGHKVTLVCDRKTKNIKYGVTVYFNEKKPIGILTMEYNFEIKNYHFILTRITNYKPTQQVEVIKYVTFNRKKIDRYIFPFKSFPPYGIKFTKGGSHVIVIDPITVWN